MFRQGFSDGFMSGYMMTPVGPRQRTFAQWSLENTIDINQKAQVKQLQMMGDQMRSAFKAGLDSLAASHTQDARLLQQELQYQTSVLAETFTSGISDVTAAIRQASDYLGGELCNIRWAIEKHTDVSRQILNTLLNSLNNESRQYWEQGVRGYEQQECEIAKERFTRSLDANRTNYFAYQYLGLIAVQEEDPAEAMRNFDLARKFAPSEYHRAVAYSHLARCYHAEGQLDKAAEVAVLASQNSDDAKFAYESVTYLIRVGRYDEALKNLRRAISADWNYWSICATDASLDPIRLQVNTLLCQMRNEQRMIAQGVIDDFGTTVKRLQGIQIADQNIASRKQLADNHFREGTVFAFRKLVSPTKEAHRQTLKEATEILTKRIAGNRSALSQAQSAQSQEVWKVQSQISSLESKASEMVSSHNAGCLGGLCGTAAVISGIVFIVGLLGYMVNSGCGPQDRGCVEGVATSERVLLYSIVVLVSSLLVPVVWKAMVAQAPAGIVRAKIPELQRERERVEESSKARLATEASRLEAELSSLKRYQQDCQNKLVALGQ